MSKKDLSGLAADTRLVLAGRRPDEQHGFVNTPVYHGSTVLFASADDLAANRGRYTYGRRGSPTIDALTEAITELERGAGAVLVPSGLAACTVAILSAVGAGDHLLMVDSVYGPTRHFCDTTLKHLGIETEYYGPHEDVTSRLRPNTRAIFAESPGSQTFEIQDVPMLAEIAHRHGAFLLLDNTWATPLLFDAHAHGVDLSIQAGTKYFSGHADVLIGSVSASASAWPGLRDTHGNLGMAVGPDDIYLTLRGLRTLAVRLARHQQSALDVAQWLAGREEVAKVIHPARTDHPDHTLWQRDFSGASGLFSFVLREKDRTRVHAMLDALELFGMGYSWGGFESLIVPFDARRTRPHLENWPDGQALRIHVGLENPHDLIADLAQAFARLGA